MIWGQSNAFGVGDRSEISSSPLSADPALAAFDADPIPRVYIWRASAGEYQPLENGVNQQAYTSGDIGPEFGIAVRWMGKSQATILFVGKATSDGSAISVFRDGGAFFEAQQTELALQDAWLASNGYSPTKAGVLWVQGESDSASSESTYRASLDALMSEMEDAGFIESGSKRVLAQINSESTHYGAGVAAAKAAYVAANASTASLVSYRNYMNVDSLHLNAAGQVQLGYDAAVKLFGAAAVEL